MAIYAADGGRLRCRRVASSRLFIILLAAKSFRRSVEGSVKQDGLAVFVM